MDALTPDVVIALADRLCDRAPRWSQRRHRLCSTWWPHPAGHVLRVEGVGRVRHDEVQHTFVRDHIATTGPIALDDADHALHAVKQLVANTVELIADELARRDALHLTARTLELEIDTENNGTDRDNLICTPPPTPLRALSESVQRHAPPQALRGGHERHALEPGGLTPT